MDKLTTYHLNLIHYYLWLLMRSCIASTLKWLMSRRLHCTWTRPFRFVYLISSVSFYYYFSFVSLMNIDFTLHDIRDDRLLFLLLCFKMRMISELISYFIFYSFNRLSRKNFVRCEHWIEARICLIKNSNWPIGN